MAPSAAPWLAVWLVLQALVARGEPAVLLAPTPAELVAAERELEARVLDAEASGRAVSRLQNAAVHNESPCDGDYVMRSRAFAPAWRDAAQRARAQAQRTETIARSPTLEPLMNESRLSSIAHFTDRAEQQAKAWLEFDRLQSRSRVVCEGSMRPMPGLPDPTPRAIGEEGAPVAVWVLSGRLCPGARDIRGVAVVRGGVCMDLDPACSCEPGPVLPGAVLTP